MAKTIIQIGDAVKRVWSEPFDLDFLYHKLQKAKGRVTRIIDHQGDFRYEVFWSWPNGETCLAHYARNKIEPVF